MAGSNGEQLGVIQAPWQGYDELRAHSLLYMVVSKIGQPNTDPQKTIVPFMGTPEQYPQLWESPIWFWQWGTFCFSCCLLMAAFRGKDISKKILCNF